MTGPECPACVVQGVSAVGSQERELLLVTRVTGEEEGGRTPIGDSLDPYVGETVENLTGTESLRMEGNEDGWGEDAYGGPQGLGSDLTN